MNRKDFLKSLGLIPIAAFLGVKTLPVGADQNAPINLETQSVFVPNPTAASLRAAAQSLASRNCMPFKDHKYRGFIAAIDAKLPNYAGHSIEILGSGSILTVGPNMTHGALVFSKNSPFNVLGGKRFVEAVYQRPA